MCLQAFDRSSFFELLCFRDFEKCSAKAINPVAILISVDIMSKNIIPYHLPL